MNDTPRTRDYTRERWLDEATALVNRCVPDVSPDRAQAAAHKIVEQIARVWCWRRFDG